jgi:hypothetical protein
MISDNATTYMAAANHIKRLFESDSLQSTISNKGTYLNVHHGMAVGGKDLLA